jgi:hypothetical protein
LGIKFFHRSRSIPMWKVAFIAFVLVSGNTAVSVEDCPTPNNEKKAMTLLGMLGEWQYPDSKWINGASMSDGGDPRVPTAKCESIFTTSDSVEKVAAFFAKKFEAVKAKEAICLSSQDDSKGRSVSIRVYNILKADSSTTIVVSRAEKEDRTHITWSHLVRLPTNP